MTNGIPVPAEETGAFGLLKVNTYYQNIGFPASDVEVTVSEPDSGTVITTLRTDTEGQLPPIRLAAPPESYAQSSTMPRPFSQYDVRAVQDGQEDAVISNVQIYAGSTAIQNIFLTAAEETVMRRLLK